MRRRPGSSSSTARPSNSDNTPESNGCREVPGRSAFVLLALCVVLFNFTWFVYHSQYERLPIPLTADQAGKRGFSEHLAMEHVKALTRLGPHPVGSDALDRAVQYVLTASENIRKMAHWEVDVQLDFFHAKSGANRLTGGLFKGKTLVYSDLKHVVLRILPKYLPEAEENAILVSSHIDTVFSTEGAGDCSSCVAVMLELARGISQWAHGFKKSVIFLFNTGEEEGLNGAHSFITQHPWRSAVCLAVDLEAMGIGGKSSIFQSGSDPWAVESFARVAKYPSAQIIGQDLFLSGVIKSATDFQVYNELAGLSGLDFAYTDFGAVYHTKNDKLTLLKPGSLQHLGDNMLAFLLQAATSSYIPKGKAIETKENGQNQIVYFDILGTYMVVYSQRLASMLHNSLILQGLLIWATSLFVGGFAAVMSLCLSVLSVVLMWTFSLSLTLPVAFLLPIISSSPVPYIANPWLVIGLFGAPAVLGALIGQHIGYLILQKYLRHVASLRDPKRAVPIQVDLIKWEAERWLFKGGFFQWLIVLIVGNSYKFGSSYIALVWLVSPAFAYGLMEATLSPMRSPKQLKIVTLVLGLSVPVLISAGLFVRLMGMLIGIIVRSERNPGATPEWLGNVVIAVSVVAIICLTMVYLLSYAHLSGAKKSVILATCVVFGLSIVLASAGVIPPFTDDVSRAINVVHVVEAAKRYGEKENPISYVSLFSITPGKLTKELESLKDEEFVCGKEKRLDLVTYSVNYGCHSSDGSELGWSKSEIPLLQVKSDSKTETRTTRILLDTKVSTRWSLAINTREIEDFKFGDASSRFRISSHGFSGAESIRDVAQRIQGDMELVSSGNKTSVDGWHTIQFSGGKNAPTEFEITLLWYKNSTRPACTSKQQQQEDSHLLLKLRTDINRITPKTARVLEKLPSWCSLFGKSTSPYTLAFLSNLPVEI